MKTLNTVTKSQGQKFLFLLIVLVVVGGLFIPFPTINLWWREALNSSHVILFFFISLSLYFLFSAKPFFTSTVVIYIAVLIAGLVIGIGIEILQGVFQREASADDVLRDLLGILSGLSFTIFTNHRGIYKKLVTGAVSLSLFLLGIVPLFQISWDYLQREKVFPSITAFEEEWFSRFIHFDNAQLVGEIKLDNNGDVKLHQIRFDPGQYSGVEIIELEKDWSAYKELHFQIYSNETSDITLVLKIYDENHNQSYDDRFNRRFIIRPGLNEITVDLFQVRDAPASRVMDLAEISTVQMFLVNVDSPVFLGLSDLYLEK